MNHPVPLKERHCVPAPAGTPAMTDIEITEWLGLLPEWEFRNDAITKTYLFPDYGKTMAFANAVSWIAAQQDHHPEMIISYNRCKIAFNTHSVNGISMNDFICAARTDALL